MGLRIATNLGSIATQRVLNANSQTQTKSFQRLASGQRIINAADDAAGLSNGASVTVAVETQSQVALETTASSSINGSQVGTVSIVGESPDHDANANVGAVDWPPMRLKCHFYGELPNPSEVADSGKELHPSRNGAVVTSCKYFGHAKALQGFVLV